MVISYANRCIETQNDAISGICRLLYNRSHTTERSTQPCINMEVAIWSPKREKTRLRLPSRFANSYGPHPAGWARISVMYRFKYRSIATVSCRAQGGVQVAHGLTVGHSETQPILTIGWGLCVISVRYYGSRPALWVAGLLGRLGARKVRLQEDAAPDLVNIFRDDFKPPGSEVGGSATNLIRPFYRRLAVGEVSSHYKELLESSGMQHELLQVFVSLELSSSGGRSTRTERPLVKVSPRLFAEDEVLWGLGPAARAVQFRIVVFEASVV